MAVKVPVKRSVGRPKGSKNVKVAKVVKPVAKRPVGRPPKVVPKPAGKRPVGRPKGSGKAIAKKVGKKVATIVTREREVDPITGFTIGTDQQVIADALLEGADTRQDIIESLRSTLKSTTRNGTEKPIANLVSSVFNRLALAGFTLESHWKLLPPTTASKRKATRLANKAS